MRHGEVFATNIKPIAREDLLVRFKRKGVVLLPSVKYERINNKSVVITREGNRQSIPAETILVAAGAVPEESLVGALRAKGLETYTIDVCASSGKIADALREAARLGR